MISESDFVEPNAPGGSNGEVVLPSSFTAPSAAMKKTRAVPAESSAGGYAGFAIKAAMSPFVSPFASPPLWSDPAPSAAMKTSSVVPAESSAGGYAGFAGNAAMSPSALPFESSFASSPLRLDRARSAITRTLSPHGGASVSFYSGPCGAAGRDASEGRAAEGRAAEGRAAEDDTAQDDTAEDDAAEDDAAEGVAAEGVAAEDGASNTMDDGIEDSDVEASGSNDDPRPPMPKVMPRGGTKRRAQKVNPRLLLVEQTGRVIDYDDEDYAPPSWRTWTAMSSSMKRRTRSSASSSRARPARGDRGGRMVVALVTRALEPDLVLFVVGLGPTPGKVENALLTKSLRHAARRLAKKRKIKVTIALLDFDPE